MSSTQHSKRELHLVRRPGSPQARRDKLRETMPMLEQAHANGWRWPEILEMARELLGEPQMSLRALINLRYRYKRLLAKRPELSEPTPSPIAPPVGTNTAAEPPVQPSGESAIARARRLQQQDKAPIEAQIAPQQQQVPAATTNAAAAAHSLSGGAPRTVARKVEEIAHALGKVCKTFLPDCRDGTIAT